jgi:hypothetical protein
MKKVFLLILPLLWIAGAAGQITPCWYDSLRLKAYSTIPNAQLDEDLFYTRLNKWRDNNTLNLFPTPYPTPCGGCLQILPTCFRAKFVIPVVVHVIYIPGHSYGSYSNISNEQIQDQIDNLNRYFANYGNSNLKSVNTGIQFCLAPVGPNGNGITRIPSYMSNHKPDSMFQLMNLKPSGLLYEDYLHIYVVNEIVTRSGAVSGIGGYATFPGTSPQGIVIRYKRFGDSNTCIYNNQPCRIDRYTEGKVLVHEVGHFLGLKHPFEGGCAGMSATNCASQGDKCCDVPPDSLANYGCSSTPVNSCHEDKPDYPDMLENYMDYTNDACRNTFTRNQTEIMHFTLLTLRSRLVSPKNINAINLGCCSFSARFVADINVFCKRDSVRFTALKYSNQSPTYLWEIRNGNTLIHDTTVTYYKYSWYLPTSYANYKVTLKVIIGSDTATESIEDFIQYVDCGSALKSTQGNWYFGEYAGLKFMQKVVIPDYNASNPSSGIKTISTGEGCVSVCDSLGNLLFYGGGIGWGITGCNIFNQNHVLSDVKDTTDKLVPPGSGTSTQGVVAFPNPDNRAQYLIFTNESDISTSKLYMTVFDTTQGSYGKLLKVNFGSGVNSFANYPKEIYTTSTGKSDTTSHVYEQLAAVSQCNGLDYWLLTVTDSTNDETFGIRHLTSYSIKSATSIVATGRVKYRSGEKQGPIKVSPDGSLVAVDRFIYKFDRKTGLFSILDSLGTLGMTTVYGLSFSPNSKVLYYIENNNGLGEEYIWQLDLSIAKPTLNKKKVNISPRGYFSTLQLGPDKKLYVSISDNDRLAVINNPDSLISFAKPTNCGFSEDGPYVQVGGMGGSCDVGLPNMNDAKPSWAIDKDIVTVQYGCDSVMVRTNVCCASTYEWNFGDGSTHIFTKEAKHVYSSNGTYIISLTMGSTVIKDTITVGIVQNNISGPTSACNKTLFFNYHTDKAINGGYNYSWTCTNGSVNQLSQTPYQADVKWNGPGTLVLFIKDTKTGCTSSSSINVTIRTNITNNTISLNQLQIACKGKDKDTIKGTIPNGVSGGFIYGWMVKYDGDRNWTILSNEKGRNDTIGNKANGRSASYKRFIYDYGCYAESNEVHICNQKNTISKVNGTCGGTAVGSSMDCYNGNYTLFQWQVSANGTSGWTDIPGTYGLKTTSYAIPSNDTIKYYRRKAIEDTCTTYSNVINTKNDPIKYQEDMQDQYICTNTPSQVLLRFFSGLEDVCGGAVNQFYRKQVGGSAAAINNYLSPITYNNLDTVYCVQSLDGGKRVLTSRKAVIYKASGAPGISTHPSNQTSVAGASATFSATVTNGTGSKFTWQISLDNSVWTDLKNSPNSASLTLTGLNACQKNTYYRLRVVNGCGTVNSNSASLTVNGLPLNPPQDYWMKDQWKDTGREINIDTGDLVRSVDLWIRNDPDGKKPSNLTENQFIADFNNDSGNFIYYTVRNKGKDTAKNGKLFLYWTWGGTKEEWSKNWTNNPDNLFTNGDKPYNQYPMGGLITTTPINLPPIPPNGVGHKDSVKDYYQWTVDVPKPTWYYPWSKGDTTHHNRANICLLARIQTCDDPPYGMTYKEKKDILYNVGSNNNIVTRNAWMYYLHPPGGTSPLVYINGHGPAVDGGTVLVGNTNPTAQTIKLCIDASDNYFYSKAEVFVELNSDLNDVWKTSGFSSTGLTWIEGNIYQVNIGGGCINSLYVPAYFSGVMKFYFRYKDDNDQFSDDETYSISLTQYGPLNVKQGQSWFEIRDNPIIPQSTYSYLISPGSDIENTPLKEKNNKSIMVYPNPSNSSTTIEWKSNLENSFTINILDISGKILFTKSIYSNNTGTYKELINLNHLPDGVYIIKVSADGFNGIEKFILIK